MKPTLGFVDGEILSRAWARCAIVSSMIMFVIYRQVSSTIPMVSDNAGVLLQAQDFVHGNYLLRGWTEGSFSVFTTELPYYVIGLLVAGLTPSLMFTVSALLFTTVVLLSGLLVYCERDSRSLFCGVAVTIALLAFPWGFSAELLLVPVFHVGTIVMLLAALLCLELISRQPSRWWLAPIFMVLLTCSVMDDKFAMYIGALPMIVVLVLRSVFGLPRLKKHIVVLAALAIASVPLGREIAREIALNGGFAARPPSAAITPLSVIPLNIISACRGILLLFGADPFDPFASRLRPLLAAAALIHLMGIALVAAGVWRVLVRWVKRDDARDLIPQILVAGIVIDIGCYLTANIMAQIYKNPDLTQGEIYESVLYSARYLVPTLIYGAVTAGIEMPSFEFRRPLSVFIVAVYIAAFGVRMLNPYPNEGNVAGAAESWLLQHGLTEGYGDYSAAEILTVESRGAIRIRQVAVSDSGYHPFRWNSNERWYRDSEQKGGGFNFLIVDGSNPTAGVNEESALKFFGRPTDRKQIANYTILVWDKRLPVRTCGPCVTSTDTCSRISWCSGGNAGGQRNSALPLSIKRIVESLWRLNTVLSQLK